MHQNGGPVSARMVAQYGPEYSVLTVIKEAGGGAVMWLGALAIPLIYKSMFGKKDDETNDQNKDITLKK